MSTYIFDRLQYYMKLQVFVRTTSKIRLVPTPREGILHFKIPYLSIISGAAVPACANNKFFQL